MSATHVITRLFPHTQPLHIGQEVDASEWYNRDLLINQGYLAEIPKKESKPKAEVEIEIAVPTPKLAAAAESFAQQTAKRSTAKGKSFSD